MTSEIVNWITLPSEVNLQLVLGGGAIAAYAYKRFGTPSTIRSTTTALRYHTSAALYFLLALTVYLLLALAPELVELGAATLGVATIIGQPTDQLIGMLKELSPALLAVIFMTVVLPGLPLARQIDAGIRRSFQRMARIPHEVRQLSRRLASADYEIVPERRRVVLDYLEANGFGRSGRNLESDLAWQTWQKVTNLMLLLGEWKESARYGYFVEDYESEFQALLHSYETRRPLALEYFRLTRRLRQDVAGSPVAGPADGDVTRSQLDISDFENPLETVLRRYRRIFIAQCDDLLERIYDFAGRGILQCSSTERARVKAIEGLGFRPLIRVKPSADQIVLVYLLLMVAVMVTLTALSGIMAPPAGVEESRRFMLFLMIPTVHCIAILWAIYPKDVWELAKISEDGVRPYRFYVLAGALALVTAVPVFILLSTLQLHSLQAALAKLEVFWPILLLSSGTAAFTAFNLDNRGGRHLRWLEGLGQGLAQCLLAFMVGKYLLIPNFHAAGQPLRDTIEIFGMPIAPLIMSFIIGFLIGVVVPSMYRARLAAGGSAEPESQPVDRPVEVEPAALQAAA